MKLCQFILPGLKALHTFYTCSNLSWIPCTGSVYSAGGVRVFKGDRRREMEDVITLCSLLCVCVCCRPIAWKQLRRRLGKKRKCMMIEYPPPPAFPSIDSLWKCLLVCKMIEVIESCWQIKCYHRMTSILSNNEVGQGSDRLVHENCHSFKSRLLLLQTLPL